MKALLLTIMMILSVTAESKELYSSGEPTSFEAIENMEWLPAVYLLLLDQQIVSSTAPSTGAGKCSIVISGVLHVFGCNVNETISEFDDE